MTALNETHDPARTSWVASANATGCDFPIQNLPFGVFRPDGDGAEPMVGVAIGDRILDVAAVAPAPSMKAWQGKGGSKLWAVPASVPTVSTPMPIIGADWASQRAHSGASPGVCGPVSSALRKWPASFARLAQPVR